IECRSILTKSGIDGVDYAVNPYVGCAHACVYCYATFMKRFTGHQEPWGTFVDVKTNAAQVMARQIRGAKRGSINLSTVTDAYQPLEEQYRVTRACLEALAGCDYPITVLTKSALVLRDLDLLARLPDVEVAFTISALDETLRERFEPGASPFAARLAALRALAEAGVRTWAFCGPLLPFLSDSEEQVDTLFAALKDACAGSVLVDSLNLRGAAWGAVRAVLEAHYPDLVAPYHALATNRRPYHAALMDRTRRLAARHELAWREVRIVYQGDA
ncbi:MAG TPA: radical SAM protein, partial [Anaerolineae bacterium]|nr:radical SAM protein [Anaerolineae bacterium]